MEEEGSQKTPSSAARVVHAPPLHGGSEWVWCVYQCTRQLGSPPYVLKFVCRFGIFHHVMFLHVRIISDLGLSRVVMWVLWIYWEFWGLGTIFGDFFPLFGFSVYLVIFYVDLGPSMFVMGDFVDFGGSIAHGHVLDALNPIIRRICGYSCSYGR